MFVFSTPTYHTFGGILRGIGYTRYDYSPPHVSPLHPPKETFASLLVIGMGKMEVRFDLEARGEVCLRGLQFTLWLLSSYLD